MRNKIVSDIKNQDAIFFQGVFKKTRRKQDFRFEGLKKSTHATNASHMLVKTQNLTKKLKRV